jgi:hypothetical protein
MAAAWAAVCVVVVAAAAGVADARAKGESLMRGFSRRGVRWFVLLGSLALGLGACASSEQWAEWRSHPSHFASGDHMGFSLKNMGDTPRVNRRDMQAAGTQNWWGKPVVPRPGQIFEE